MFDSGHRAQLFQHASIGIRHRGVVAIALLRERHGGEPDPEVAEALAAEWMEGTLPQTWFAAPPERVRFQYNLIGDWIPDDPVTRGVLAMMPEWVRWLGERAGLDERFRVRALAVARAGVRQPAP